MACKGAPPHLEGQGFKAWAGLDLSKSRDMSSLIVLVDTEDGKLWCKGYHWYPIETATERQQSYRMPLLNWGRDGHLELCPGGVIDYEAIMDRIRHVAREFNLVGVWFDPMACGWGEQVLERQDGIQMGALKQSIQYLSPGTCKILELCASKQLQHDGDPVLRAALQGSRSYTDCNANTRLDRKRSDGLIDPAMALVMAVSNWMTSETTSAYETQQLRIFG